MLVDIMSIELLKSARNEVDLLCSDLDCYAKENNNPLVVVNLLAKAMYMKKEIQKLLEDLE